MKKGFSLPEILTVLAIIAIIAVIAIPSVILIRERINKRIYESKKEMIILAAELYGQENRATLDAIGELLITVGELIELGYVEKEVDKDDVTCLDEYGCVIDPRSNVSLNNVQLVVKLSGANVKALWEGTPGSSSEQNLVEIVLTDLNCTPTASSPCLYTEEETNNYLSYSGMIWRIIGVYVIDGQNVVKMITDENVE